MKPADILQLHSGVNLENGDSVYWAVQTMRSHVSLVVFCRWLVLLMMFGSPLAAWSAAEKPARPNVLFIAVDDLNHWVGYLGRNSQTVTPNLDRLAKRGVWFTRSYCAAPVCNPSRAALMSGLRPGASGVYDNGENFAPVIPTDITLTTQFRKAGYYVCGAGKIYHASVYREGEWDDWMRNAGGKAPREEDGSSQAAVKAGKLPITPLNCRDEDMPDYQFASYAIDQLNRKHTKPFFIACGLTKPHLPWSVPRKYYDKFPLETIQLPPYREDDLDDLPPVALQMARGPANDHETILNEGGTNTWKQAIRAYLAAINFCDTMVGRLLDAYDKSPERDNTIICFWSDHGWHLGEKHHWRKFALWEETTRAPHIWVVPGVTKPDGRCDRTVDYMGIYPTLMDLCGLPTPAHVQGRSIRALLANPGIPWNEPAVTTYRQNNHSVRSETWRYTRYSDGGEELYNEAKDPYEWTNLARQPDENQAAKKELGKYLPKDNQPPAKGAGASKTGVDSKKKNRKKNRD
jgi:arylsulfatase A-like enzyme